jgi:hypothetical protein
VYLQSMRKGYSDLDFFEKLEESKILNLDRFGKLRFSFFEAFPAR